VDDEEREELRREGLLKIARWEADILANPPDAVTDHALAAIGQMRQDWSGIPAAEAAGAPPQEDSGSFEQQRARRLAQMDRWVREAESDVRAGVPGAGERLDTIRRVRTYEQLRQNPDDLVDPEP
jgi:hypothetical protein